MIANEARLSPEQRRLLLDIAAEAIRRALLDAPTDDGFPAPSDDPALSRPAASFVTLERDGDLLGCIGSLEADEPLAAGVVRHARAAAFADPRVPPVTRDDYEVMSIKVSVLSHLELLPVSSITGLVDRVRPRTDGLVVSSGAHRGTLLPSVWDHLADPDEFLAALWHKAGLRPGSWPIGIGVERYTTQEFGDPGPRLLAQPLTARNAAPTITAATITE